MATMMDAPVNVTPATNGMSRLAQMQARFQQKQMQEKEQKLLRLYESQTQRAFQRVGRGSAGSSSSSVSSTSSSLGAGKVRQLFQERRQNRSYSNGNKAGGTTGWDRSYPLEPLENTTTTKQRLQASKSTGNLKAARGASLERSYSNNIPTSQYQAKNLARRSKSQVRSNHQNVVVDLGGSFRQLSHSQQKLYYEDDDYDDDVDYSRNHRNNHRNYQDEQNNRLYLEREHREAQLFNKHRIYDNEDDDDIENEDPPFQQLDDDDDDDDVNVFNGSSSQVFQKLPNVGGRLQMENNNNNNNVDRYKTYNATTNGIRNVRRSVGDREDNRKMSPPAAAPAKEPLRRRESDTNRPAVRTSPTSRKPEAKVGTYTTTKGPIPRNTGSPLKLDSPSRTLAEPNSWNKKALARKPSTEDTERQMQSHTPSIRGSVRGASGSQNVNISSSSSRTPQSGGSVTGRTPTARGPSKSFAPASNVDLAECKICGRHFAKDRLAVHENICSKTTQKKRKVFDPTKQRISGTEAEAFVRKGKPQVVHNIKKSNWRQKHEDFINSIRAAKEMKAHIARGGKLSDLPPPPPSDYSDYVQCPHCGRRFNQAAAERHIPKCANYQFNKPKPGSKGAVSKKR